MIRQDEEVKGVIERYTDFYNKSFDSKKMFNIILILNEHYSFVENQTYPRPSHPFENKRKDSYYTLIAIILSLRTTLENEVKAVELFMSKYNSIDAVIHSDEKELADTIKVAGMPQKKAHTIINISNYIQDKYNGDINNIKKDSIEETREELLKIPGIGEKSADCMLELGFNMPSMVVDVNVFRTCSRIFGELWADKPDFSNRKQIAQIKNRLENNLPSDYLTYQIVHTFLLLHGKHICKSKCNCKNCCITKYCEFYKSLG